MIEEKDITYTAQVTVDGTSEINFVGKEMFEKFKNEPYSFRFYKAEKIDVLVKKLRLENSELMLSIGHLRGVLDPQFIDKPLTKDAIESSLHHIELLRKGITDNPNKIFGVQENEVT